MLLRLIACILNLGVFALAEQGIEDGAEKTMRDPSLFEKIEQAIKEPSSEHITVYLGLALALAVAAVLLSFLFGSGSSPETE